MGQEFRSGFAVIIGRANVGKSTLLNAMIGEKVAIISDKPQTTRNRIHGVLTRPDYQIIFIDTPGIHNPKTKLGEYMVRSAIGAMDEVDVILFMLDIEDGIGYGDKKIADSLKDAQAPVIVIFNKIDQVSPATSAERIQAFMDEYDFKDLISISALTGYQVDKLEEMILSNFEEGPKYYPDDMITDQPERVIIAELIREKALELLKEEVPHGIGVEIMHIQEREEKPLMEIHATIYVERKSHKAIVIGKGGQMLKEIGQKARADIEGLLGIKVYLELWVKVTEDWRNSVRTLKNLGYD